MEDKEDREVRQKKLFSSGRKPLHLSRLPRKPSSSLLGLNYEVRRSHLTGMLSLLSTCPVK